MAMTPLMLDTSAYVAFKKGHRDALMALRQAEKILLPTIVLGELLAGFEAGSRRQKNRLGLEEFQKSPRVSVVPVTTETAERYAHIYAYLRKNGRPIPTNDLWIAASAMEHSAELLTYDAHFLSVVQVLVTYINAS
jgi:tRNA(fMet)-specific endonuclease VapC